MQGLQYVAQKSRITTFPFRSFTFWTFPSKPVQLISGTGFNGCAWASIALTPLTDTGLLPTETGAAAGRHPAKKRHTTTRYSLYISADFTRYDGRGHCRCS